MVAGQGCDNCNGKTFNRNLSKTFIELEKEPDNLVVFNFFISYLYFRM